MARRYLAVPLLLLALPIPPTLAQSTFADYMADCRRGDNLSAECAQVVHGFYAEISGTTPERVTCDGAALWKAGDAAGDAMAARPWHEALQELATEPGVCTLREPTAGSACASGSPDAISVRSWTATPDPASGGDAVRLDYVLVNTLDKDIVHFYASAIVRDGSGGELFATTLQDTAMVPAGGEFTTSTTVMGDTALFADPSLSITACTMLVVDSNEVEHRF